MAIAQPVYRRVYYRPGPWTAEGRIEIGRLVRLKSGTRFVPNLDVENDNPHLRVEDIAVIRIVIEDLEEEPRFNSLPPSVGPHIELGEPYRVVIMLGEKEYYHEVGFTKKT